MPAPLTLVVTVRNSVTPMVSRFDARAAICPRKTKARRNCAPRNFHEIFIFCRKFYAQIPTPHLKLEVVADCQKIAANRAKANHRHFLFTPERYTASVSDTLVDQRNLFELARRKHLRRAAVRFYPAHRLRFALLVLRHRLCLHRRQKNITRRNSHKSSATGRAVFRTFRESSKSCESP